MKKLILPDNYRDLVTKAIIEEDNNIACSFLRIFDFIIENEEIEKIHPDNVNISFDFMNWIMDMPTKFRPYTNIHDLEWAWFLLNSGPARNRKINDPDAVLYFDDRKELDYYMRTKNFKPTEIIYLKASVNNSELKIFKKQPQLYSIGSVVLLN